VAIQQYGIQGAVFLLFLGAVPLALASFWTEICGHFLRPAEWLSLAGVAFDVFGRERQAHAPAEVRADGNPAPADRREAATVPSGRPSTAVMVGTTAALPLAPC
jgi:hypothetical protein